jgi:hypothetical protein
MRRRVVVLGTVVVLGLGCATAPAKVSAQDAFGAAPAATPGGAAPQGQGETTHASRRPAAAPEKWARSFARSGECEAAARSFENSDGHEVAWTYLKGCIARPDFGLLPALLDNWAADLKSRPEAATLLAQVIANRGGSVGADLQLLQQRRLPVFELSAALKQPQAFKGRYLLFVARVSKLREVKGRSELVLAERARMSEQSDVFALGGHGSSSSSSGSSSSYSSSSGSARFQSSGMLGSGSASGSGSTSRESGYSSGSMSKSGALEQRVTFEFEDTGQEIHVRLAQPDPFLSVDRSFVFLVRFDGAKKVDVDEDTETEEPTTVALVSLVSYHDVNVGGVISR